MLMTINIPKKEETVNAKQSFMFNDVGNYEIKV